MADAKTTPEQWQRARIQWETEPLASYAQIAESLAVSKPLVGQHAKREGWQKRLTSEAVSAKAREKVDSKFTENPARSEIQAAGVDAAPQQKRHTVELPDIPLGLSETDARAAAEAAVIAKREALLERHGKELDAVRGLAYGSIKRAGQDDAFETGKHAKVVAEALKIVQEQELKRMRMVDGDGGNKAPRALIVVNQVAGLRIVH